MFKEEIDTLEIVCPAVEDGVTASVVNIGAYLNMYIIIRYLFPLQYQLVVISSLIVIRLRHSRPEVTVEANAGQQR